MHHVHGVPTGPAAHERRRARRLLLPVGTVVAVVGAAVLAHAVDPHEPGHYPTCPFLVLTGFDCPGCGTLRALNSLTHGDLLQAVDHNVLTVATLPALAVWWGAWLVRSWRGLPRRWVAPAWSLYLLAVVQVAWWLGRNLPGLEALRA